MSKLDSVLVIKPDTGSKNNGSVHSSRGHSCPYCNGKGGFSDQTGFDSYDTKECPRCKGTGRLVAKIVVGWGPDYENGNV